MSETHQNGYRAVIVRLLTRRHSIRTGMVGASQSRKMETIRCHYTAMMLNTVVDLSHHNASVDFHAIKDAGIEGLIHKATQGRTFKDARYPIRQAAAKAAGLFWGAYHFGVNASGKDQADFFLSHVDPHETLLALDLESNAGSPGGSMTLAQAVEFVLRIHEKTGRYPGLYSGNTIKEMLHGTRQPELANCWLWLAQYSPTPNLGGASSTWSQWTLWQYTDGAMGSQPRSVPGVGLCDRNKYDGDLDSLRSFWRSNS